MTKTKPKIHVRGLAKSFGRKTVLDGVDFDVAAGESLVIIGGSGTGKSVSIKCVLGLIEPDAGTIEIDGESAIGLRGRERDAMMGKFGMLFQGGALFDSMSVWENVAFRLMQGRSSSEAREAAVETLGMVGLGADVADLLPAELSGGMMKRVALARAIAARPEIIFFDEPTTGLDPITADVINDLIISAREKLGVSTVSITHDMASVRKIADKVAMLHAGKLVWTGPVGEIDHSDNAFVDQFINGRAEGPISMDIKRP
ncbi:MAG: ABC transporter ATP-binding protein [Rhodospirillaceae bacterium]|nr:ABC transporter ATP-binding protein [Rhodospirillaceae bacterium]|tara:strand:- start:6141 stop:6914 length:774 start_codon:yes stop_codon:yes gene_type:complete